LKHDQYGVDDVHDVWDSRPVSSGYHFGELGGRPVSVVYLTERSREVAEDDARISWAGDRCQLIERPETGHQMLEMGRAWTPGAIV
jgi:hypothetical protein